MLRRLYNWMIYRAGQPNAERWLACIAFFESSVFPIPPDVVFVPMILANPARAMRLAMVCTLFSVLGGVFGYAIGYGLYETIGRQVVGFYGLESSFEHFKALYAEYGMWVILVKGLTPLPYKLITIASGAAHYNIGLFVLLSFITRGARFFLIALLLKKYGAVVQHFIERRLTLVTTMFVGLLVGGVFLLRGF